MAITFTGAGVVANTASAGNDSITLTQPFAVGDYLVLLLAYDNSGGGGADPASGSLLNCAIIGVGSQVSSQSGLNDPSTASSGLAVKCAVFPITSAIATNANGAVTWGGSSIVARAIAAIKVSSSFAGAGGTVAYRTNSGATGTNTVGATTTAPVNTPSVNSGEGVLCWAGHENGAAPTGDSDTTNGSWSAIYGTFAGTGLTGMAAYFQSKVVTATGVQQCNWTGTSSDWITGSVIFTETVVATVTQASYQFFDDAGTESGASSLAAQDTPVTGNLSSGDGYGALRVRLQSTNAVNGSGGDYYRVQWEKNASGTWTDVVTDITMYDAYLGTNFSSFRTPGSVGAETQIGQSFTGSTGRVLSRVEFWMARTAGLPTGTLKAVVYAHTGTFGSTGVPTGAVLATSTTTITAADVGTSFNWVTFDFDRTLSLVSSGTRWFVAVQFTGTADVNNYYQLGEDNTSPTASGNVALFSGTWAATAAEDLCYRIYTSPSPVPTTVIGYDNPNLTADGATTQRLTGGTGTFVPGAVAEVGYSFVALTGNNFTEMLYSLKILAANLAGGDVLRFRVTRNDSTTGMTWASTPTLNIKAPFNEKLLPLGITATTTCTDVAHCREATGLSIAATVTCIDTPPITVIPATGLVGWYDADDATTITASAGSVSQWTGKSGKGSALTQGTSANQPTTGTRTLNGHNALDFSDDALTFEPFTQPQPITLFAVVQADFTDALNRQIVGNWGTNPTLYVTGQTWNVWNGGNLDSLVPVNLSPHYLRAVFNGASSGLWIDGTTAITGTLPTPGWVAQKFVLGAGDNVGPPGYFWDGLIAEVIVYNRVLTAPEITQVESYLATKWFPASTNYNETGRSITIAAATTVPTERVGRKELALSIPIAGTTTITTALKDKELSRSIPIAGTTTLTQRSGNKELALPLAIAGTTTTTSTAHYKEAGGAVISPYLFTEDWNTADSDHWDWAKWPVQRPYNTIVSNQGVVTPSGGPSVCSSDKYVTDFEMTVKMEWKVANPAYPELCWRLYDGLGGYGASSGYIIQIKPNGRVDIYRVGGYSDLGAGGGVDDPSLAAAGVRWFKVRVVGNNHKVKWWNDGSAEPGTWQLDANDSAPLTDTQGAPIVGGAVGFRSYGTPPIYVDNLTITDLASPPLPVTDGSMRMLSNAKAVTMNGASNVFPSDTDLTWCGWVNYSAYSGNSWDVWSTFSGGSTYCSTSVTPAGDLRQYMDTGDFSPGYNVPLNTWVFLAMSRSITGGTDIYWAPAGTSTLSTAHTASKGTVSGLKLRVLSGEYGSNPYANGCAFKVWTAALTKTQLEAEMTTYAVQRTANLFLHYSMRDGLYYAPDNDPLNDSKWLWWEAGGIVSGPVATHLLDAPVAPAGAAGLTLAIAATVTETDTYHIGSTGFNETGRSIPIAATVTPTDIVHRKEIGLSLPIAGTVATTDLVHRKELALSVPVAAATTLTIDQADFKEPARSLPITATVAVNDAFGHLGNFSDLNLSVPIGATVTLSIDQADLDEIALSLSVAAAVTSTAKQGTKELALSVPITETDSLTAKQTSKDLALSIPVTGTVTATDLIHRKELALSLPVAGTTTLSVDQVDLHETALSVPVAGTTTVTTAIKTRELSLSLQITGTTTMVVDRAGYKNLSASVPIAGFVTVLDLQQSPGHYDETQRSILIAGTTALPTDRAKYRDLSSSVPAVASVATTDVRHLFEPTVSIPIAATTSGTSTAHFRGATISLPIVATITLALDQADYEDHPISLGITATVTCNDAKAGSVQNLSILAAATVTATSQARYQQPGLFVDVSTVVIGTDSLGVLAVLAFLITATVKVDDLKSRTGVTILGDADELFLGDERVDAIFVGAVQAWP